MAKASPSQENFNGGEISSLVQGRVSLPRYKESLKTCKNYLPLIQGPVTRRPGTKFVFHIKDQAAVTRLIPFEASTTESYVLEFGNGYIRAYNDNAILTTGFPKSITAITQADPAVVTSTNHGRSNGDKIVITGIVGMTELNNREFVVAGATAHTFQLTSENSTSYTAYTSGGTLDTIYELTSATDVWGSVTWPFTTARIPDLQFTQSNEVLYIVHPEIPPFKLSLSGSPFTLTQIGILDGPYFDQGYNASGATATISTGTTGGLGYQAVSSNNTNGINGGAGFSNSDIGRLIRLQYDSVWYWGRIQNCSNTTNITIRHIAFPDTRPPDSQVMTAWQLGVWSDRDGWPAAVCFHEDRLVFGGAGGQPTGFVGSNTADYENFAPSASDGEITADNAYSFLLNSADLNAIQWITSDEQGMLVGTAGGEWMVTSSSPNSALSALSISAKRSTAFGSKYIQAVQSGKCALFVQRGGRKLRELNFYFDVNGFRAADLTQVAEHITNGGITQLAVQKIPQPIVWALRADGVLLSMTYERELDSLKVGWSRHIIGGTVSGGGDAVVESIAVIPSADGTSQELWVIVQRYINGATKRYVEYLTPFFDDSMELEDAFFVDSGLTYDGVSTSTVSGLNHLNGQTVSVLADGAKQANTVVLNGRVTLSPVATKAQIGLAYNSDGQKLRSDAGSTDGTAMGKTRRTHRFGMLLHDTLGLQVGPDFDTLDTIDLADTSDENFDSDRGLYSGIRTELVSSDYDFDNTICWRQSDPYPGTILGLYPQMVTQDR